MIKSGMMIGCVLLLSACATAVELPVVASEDLPSSEAGFAPANGPATETLAEELATVDVDTSAVEAPRRGFFGRLFGKSDETAKPEEAAAPDAADDAAQAVETAAENVTDPVDTPTEEAAADPSAEPAKDEKRGGLFGLFKKRKDPIPEASGAAVAAAVESVNPAEGKASEGGDEISAQEAAALGEPEKPRRGLFGLFGKREDKPAPETTDENTIVASIDPDTITDAEPPLTRRQKRAAKTEIPIGTVLPYGQVGVACNVRGRKLGKEVDQFNQRGKDFKLYDTSPNSIKSRTFFLTGFKDGCARQFTGAMASLGSPVLHERMRLDSYNKSLAYTETDRAYDKIRKRLCKTSGKTLCPQERVDALEAETAYVTVYEQFGANLHWAEILLHKGKLVATSIR